MNRNASIVLLMTLCVLMTACSGKYEEWYEPENHGDRPVPVSVTFRADSVAPIDLRTLTRDSVRIFRPTITCEKPYTVTYKVNVYNGDRTDSVTLKAYSGGRALREPVQEAIVWLLGPDDQERELALDITADIVVEGVTYRGHADSIPLLITPRRQELAPVWWVLGSHLGNGAWTNDSSAIGVSLLPMYANPKDYSQLTYAGYFPAGSELRLVPLVGNDQRYIGGGDENGGQSLQAEEMQGDPLDNIIIGRAGYYQVPLDVPAGREPTVQFERLAASEAVTFTSMALTHPATAMTPFTTVSGGKNHDWIVRTAELADDDTADFSGEYVAAADSTGTTMATLAAGGNAFPAGRAITGTGGTGTQGGNYLVVFNDLLRTYRFIKQ